MPLEKDRTAAVWGASPAGTTHAPGEIPGTKAFFERVAERRDGREIRWLRELVPFAACRGRRRFRGLVAAAGFQVMSVKVRKLLREDLPDLPLLRRLWPHLPEAWLDAAGRRFGWYLIVQARKPAAARADRGRP